MSVLLRCLAAHHGHVLQQRLCEPYLRGHHEESTIHHHNAQQEILKRVKQPQRLSVVCDLSILYFLQK